MHEHFFQDDHHEFLNDAQVTLIDKTQASDLTNREYFWMRALKHTTHMIWILRRHVSGCWYVGLLHDFVRFFEALGMSACTGFWGTVLGYEYLDIVLEFLILLLVPVIKLFIISLYHLLHKLGLHKNFLCRSWRYMGFWRVFNFYFYYNLDLRLSSLL